MKCLRRIFMMVITVFIFLVIYKTDFIQYRTVAAETVMDGKISPGFKEFDKNNQADISVTIEWNKATAISVISKNNVALASDDYSVQGNILTIKKEYLCNLPEGVFTLRIDFNKGSMATLMVSIINTVTNTQPKNNNDTIEAILRYSTFSFDFTNRLKYNAEFIFYNATKITDIKKDGVSLSTDEYEVLHNKLSIDTTYEVTQDVVVFTIYFDIGKEITVTFDIPNSLINKIPVSAYVTPDDITFYKNYSNQKDITTKIVWNDASRIQEISRFGGTLLPKDYILQGDELTIKKEYLDAMPAGMVYIKIKFNVGMDYLLKITISDSIPIITPTVAPVPDHNHNELIALLNKVRITPTAKTLYVGGTKDASTNIKIDLPDPLMMKKKDESTSDNVKDNEVKITYKTSKRSVADVNPDGKITAKGVGTATITTIVETHNGLTETFSTKITVKKPYIVFIKSVKEMKLGDIVIFQAKAYGVDVKEIQWLTTNKLVIEINQLTGKAYAKSKGTDYVVAKIGNVVKKVKVVVK